jgi:hypothetical protein
MERGKGGELPLRDGRSRRPGRTWWNGWLAVDEDGCEIEWRRLRGVRDVRDVGASDGGAV